MTFTCNPQWPEITAQLLPGQVLSDRLDLCATVLKLKLDEFLAHLLKREVLWKVALCSSVIEFQMRGLSHCHLLLILDDANKP